MKNIKQPGKNPKSHQHLEIGWKNSQQRREGIPRKWEKSWETIMPQKLIGESFRKEWVANCAKQLLRIRWGFKVSTGLGSVEATDDLTRQLPFSWLGQRQMRVVKEWKRDKNGAESTDDLLENISYVEKQINGQWIERDVDSKKA